MIGVVIIAIVDTIVVLDHLSVPFSLETMGATRLDHHPLAGLQHDFGSLPGVEIHELDPQRSPCDVKKLGLIKVVVAPAEKPLAWSQGKIAEVADGHAILDECQFTAVLNEPPLLAEGFGNR